MTSTASTLKNNYGRKTKKTKVPAKLRKQIATVIDEKEKKEVELKYRDREYNGAVGIDTAGVIHPLSDPQVGTARNQLIGRDFLIKNLLIRYQLFVSDSTNTIRVVIFQWNLNSIPSVTDVLEDYPSSLVVGPLSPTKIENKSNIRILYTNCFALQTGILDSVVDKVNIKRNLRAQYNDDGSKGIGHVYILLVSDSVAVAHPTYTILSRCRYTDS